MAKSKKTAKKVPKKTTKKKSTSKKPSRSDIVQAYKNNFKKDGVVEILALSDDDCLAHVNRYISTQSLALDRLLNGKGIPCGRVVELLGEEHIGKSTILDHMFAGVQAEGGEAILAEPEGARDVEYTNRLGVDPERLHYLQFERDHFHLENIIHTFYETIDFWREKAYDVPVLIGLDALGGAATKEELERGIKSDDSKNKKQPGVAARVMRESSRQFPTRLGNTNIGVVICNHEYQTFGQGRSTKKSYGGGGLRHLATLRIALYPVGEWIKGPDGTIIGRVIGARLLKNRLGNYMTETRLGMISGVGLNNVWTIHDELTRRKLIITSGGWSKVNIDNKTISYQGWLGLQHKCEEDPELFAKLVSVYKGLE